jgi:hypothetical protein
LVEAAATMFLITLRSPDVWCCRAVEQEAQ